MEKPLVKFHVKLTISVACGDPDVTLSQAGPKVLAPQQLILYIGITEVDHF